MVFDKDVSQLVPAGTYIYVALVPNGAINLMVSFTDVVGKFAPTPYGHPLDNVADIITFPVDVYVKAGLTGNASWEMNKTP